MEKITQSLARWVAILTLLPLSYFELPSKPSVEDFIFTGRYPRIIHNRSSPDNFFPTYIQSYIERDVRQLVQIQNLSLFHNFVLLLAGRAGQVFNASALANELGVNKSDYRVLGICFRGLLCSISVASLLSEFQ